MRFTQLQIRDFRGICKLDIDFEPDMTVVIGRNGAGKTSVLDALAIFMELMLISTKGGVSYSTQPSISLQDVRFGTKKILLRLLYGVDNGSPLTGQPQELVYEYGGGTAFPMQLLRHVLLQLRQGSDPEMNCLYYRQNRAFEDEDRLGRTESERVSDPDRMRHDSLARERRAIGDLQTWWDRRDAQEARMVRDKNSDYRDPQLEAIRNLVKKIDNLKDITFSSTASPPGLYLLKNDDALVHVSRLSSGERAYIVLLADLARRLQVLAPEKPLEDISAIVLVDEIELNLHPAWQSEIAPTLTKVFGSCQFVVATHSPQVLSGVESRQVRILEEGSGDETVVRVPLSTKGRTSNYLLDGVFRASERYPPIEELIANFNEAVDRNDIAAAEAEFEALEEAIGDDAPTLLVLRKRLRNLLVGT